MWDSLIGSMTGSDFLVYSEGVDHRVADGRLSRITATAIGPSFTEIDNVNFFIKSPTRLVSIKVTHQLTS